MVSSGCQMQNVVSSWDEEDASARSEDSKKVVAAEKALGEWELIFEFF